MKKTYRALCAILAWVTIIGQYLVLIYEGDFGGLAASSLAYFGYFTVLTNILVAMAFSTPFLNPENKLRLFFERQSVRAAIALYILVVAVIYWALLAAIHDPEGISAILNIGLHSVLPILYILDWLIFARKDAMRVTFAPYWTLYPIAYGIFNIIRGGLTGFYPYPFLDFTKLGGVGVSINMVGFTIFYTLGALGFIYLGRVLPAPKT